MNLSVVSNNYDSKMFWHIWNKEIKEDENLPDMNLSAFAASFKNNFIDSDLNSNAKNSFVKNYNSFAENKKLIEFTVQDIEQAVFSLNIRASLNYANLNVLHILHAHPLVFTILKLLFNKYY